MEPRLERRYRHLVASPMSSANALATGLSLPSGCASSFAATQAAWRFYANQEVTLPGLAQPLRALALERSDQACSDYVPLVLDWSNLHFESHHRKPDRTRLRHANNQGYKLLTALALSDINGIPLAPVCLELQSAGGLHSTRDLNILPASSPLDGLTPVMADVAALPWKKLPVFIIDREADSVAHYRSWHLRGWKFVIRADKERRVDYQDDERSLPQVAATVNLRHIGASDYKGRPCQWHVGEASVVLSRPAREHRVVRGKPRHRNVPGQALPLRLVVSELRDASGKVVARWLLLSNLPPTVPAATVALWYLFRWKIEGYHKLLKSGGLQVESWLQQSAQAFAKRLLVGAMAVALVWQLAADNSPEAQALRTLLVRLSCRQIKRGRGRATFTIPALLVGWEVFLPALDLLATHSPEELRALAAAAGLPIPTRRSRQESG